VNEVILAGLRLQPLVRSSLLDSTEETARMHQLPHHHNFKNPSARRFYRQQAGCADILSNQLGSI